MGRIIVFAANDINSKRLVKILEARQVPFQIVNLHDAPERTADLKVLTSSVAVPQVFFNTRFVGGIVGVQQELQRWEQDYPTTEVAFEKEIASMPDPQSAKLLPVMTYMPSIEEETKETDLLLRAKDDEVSIKLPDGTLTTVVDITEKLRNTLTLKEIKFKKTIHKQCFTGAQAIEGFCMSMDMSADEAATFGQSLVDQKVMHGVAADKGTRLGRRSSKEKESFNEKESIYRLQCHMNPAVLNSYCIWDKPVRQSAHDIVVELDQRLSVIESDSLLETGQIDYCVALIHSKFPAFEYAACELQNVSIIPMHDHVLVAFALNVYNIMVRYTCIKIGVSTTEAERWDLLRSVSFEIGGNIYSFQEWVDGVLRGNRKASYTNRVVFGNADPRRKCVIEKLDYRIHFPLNLGFCCGMDSSVPFTLFTHKNLESELETAAQVYCDDAGIVIDRQAGEIQLAKVFGWYRSDFGRTDGEILKVIRKHLGTSKKFELRNVLDDDNPIRVTYQNVDRKENAVHYIRFDKEMLKTDVKGVKAIFPRFRLAKKPQNEEIRLAAVRSLNILDTLADERFNRITHMVRSEFDVPFVFITFVDENRTVFKSVQWATDVPEGGVPTGTDREASFCSHAISNDVDDVYVVPDATEDDRFADNPNVLSGFVRFYAGAPLAVPAANDESVNIGTLCIIDQKPRSLTDYETEQLRHYAHQVRQEILRRHNK